MTPADVLGAHRTKVLSFAPHVLPNGPQREPRGIPKITKNHEKTKKEGPKRTPKLSSSKNTEHLLFVHRKYVILGALGPAKSS